MTLALERSHATDRKRPHCHGANANTSGTSVDASGVKHTNGYNPLYYPPPVSRSGLSRLFFSSYLSSAIVVVRATSGSYVSRA
ncbi:uncharacterized protein RSE6_05108 [Rhynchosporium secalis]|uniref:Uncharacterized protein n=1 Tax=Rhynchosporium secalis TaxID=38038 RepID=A0A1E1M6Z5_RHYSE|nr:uncharacterized protein RSE6_05108 [Rhynchosporium secalis]